MARNKEQAKSKTKDNKEQEEKKEQSSVQFQFSEEEQLKIAQMVVDDYNVDKASRTEYNAIMEEILFLIEGKRQSKSDPWVGCSNVNTMLTAVATEIVHSKLLPAIWNENNLEWRCEDFAFSENSYNVKKFMAWVMRTVGLGQIVDDLVYDSVQIGTTASKVRKIIKYKWVQRKVPKPEGMLDKAMKAIGIQPETKYTTRYEYVQDIQRAVDAINIEDVLFPYHAKDEQECDHIIHRFWKIYPEALDLERRNYWKNVEKKLKATIDEIVVEGKKKEDMDAEGISKVESLRDNKPLMFLEWYGKYDFNHDGILEECVFTVHHNDTPYGNKATYVSGKPLTAISRIEKRPIVIGQYIRRTNRLFGKGIGHLVYNIHKHIDSIYNQKNDAGTMSINPFGVYTPAAGFDPDEIEVSPGSFSPVDDVNGVKWLTVPNNTLATWEDIRFLISIIERLTSATPYQQGRESDVVKSGATATATMALIQEGQSMFIKTATRIARTVGKIAEQLLASYQEDMPPGLAERITGEHGEKLFPKGLSPEDIAGKYTCYLPIDTLSFNKSVKRNLDFQIYQTFAMNPIVASNPTYLWELSNMVLRAFEKDESEVERIIGKRPNTTFAELDDAKEENIQMLAGRVVNVDPQEPLFEHMVTHLAFRQTEVYKEMEPEKKVIVDNHIEDTKIALAMQLRLMKAQMEGGVDVGGGVPPGNQEGAVPVSPQVRRMGSVPTEATPGAGAGAQAPVQSTNTGQPSGSQVPPGVS